MCLFVGGLLVIFVVVVGIVVAFVFSFRIIWEYRGEGSVELGLGFLRAFFCL